jgi:hypothetical protein
MPLINVYRKENLPFVRRVCSIPDGIPIPTFLPRFVQQSTELALRPLEDLVSLAPSSNGHRRFWPVVRKYLVNL